MRNDVKKMGDGEPGGEGRDDEPRKKTAYDPIAFPRPFFYLFKRDIKAAGSKTADEMKNDTENDLHRRVE